MVTIQPSDYVVDPITNEMRKVAVVDGDDIILQDGGVMGINDPVEVYLPGEIKGFN